jgi:ferredoxin
MPRSSPSRPPLPVVQLDRCRGCGACITACPLGVLALSGGRVWLAAPDRCDYCGRCEAACPNQAISCPYEVVLAPAAGHRRSA